MGSADERYDRQIRLFGKEGQARLEEIHVALVGLGGLGSHVAQQLAYLGVLRFTLIDHDRVSRSNLNRLIGANEEDATARRRKVEVAARMIRWIQPAVKMEMIPEPFITEAGFAALLRADVVIGCMDSDPSRLILTELCQAYGRPYLDLATDIIESETGPRYGGRIVYSVPGELCLHCKEQLDQRAIDEALMTPEQRAEAERIYGVPRAALGATGPAVVSLNGLIASAAVTELMVDLVGLRPANRHLEYDGNRGLLVRNVDPPRVGCYYCKGLHGTGVSADVERYVREGWGRKLFPDAGE